MWRGDAAVSFAQAGAVAALQGPQDCVAAMVAEFKRRRDLLIPSLNAIPGIRRVWTRGAFYAFPNIRALGLSSEELTWHLLREPKIAVVPGSVFGIAGEGHLRISFAKSFANTKRALERMAEVLGKLPAQAA